ncbi:hypothetical protein MUP77_04660 [Candidatus Bathyarchaeota archaeon]|nr:hypothetical protein [Candidatus Bathyarchaeota archaeon]
MAELLKSSENMAEPRNTKIKLTESDLCDTTVVDSEGYILGKIDSLRIEPEEIFIKLYGMEKDKKQIIDRNTLNERLSKIMPARKSTFVEEALERGYQPRPQELDINKIVREQLGMNPSEPVTEEQVARYAVSLGLGIPYTTTELEARTDKGSIPWTLIDRVGSSDFGKCVILKEPYEARRRGIEVRDSVPYRSKKELEGKLVVDVEAKPIGAARDLIIGTTLGILVDKESYKLEESFDMDLLIRSLIPSRFGNFEEFKKKIAKDLNKKTVGIAEISAWCKKYNISLPVKRQTRIVADFELSVDWKDIAKIGDVIILSRTIEDLAQGQKSQKNMELIIN